ncbi:MAG: hypothetical protein R3E50_07160 [Halioglobus sp.]
MFHQPRADRFTPMNQTELLYPYSSIAIAATLFIAMLLFNETGFQIGRFVQKHTDNEIKTLTGSIQASVLGLLALMLGFTFSMSMQRYDSRSMALIDEANAIGTATLRVRLLPPEFQDRARDQLKQYIDLRVAMGRVPLNRHEQRQEYNEEVGALQHALWSLAVEATNADPRAVTTGAYVQSLNAVIDAQGRRNALQEMHVPETVLFLLFVVFIASGGMMGYSGGLSGKRIIAPVVLVALLVTLIVFIIIDLDRPKRGLIQVDQSALLELQAGATR